MAFQYHTFSYRNRISMALALFFSLGVVPVFAQQTITIPHFEPSGNGHIISNAQFKVSSGARFFGIAANTLGIWVEYVEGSGSVSGYKYEGEIYTHIPEWEDAWNYNEKLTSIGSIKVKGTVVLGGKSAGSFVDKLAYSDISPVSSSLVWEKAGLSQKVNPRSLTVKGLAISSTQSPGLDNMLDNYIKEQQRKKEEAEKKAEEERKKEEEKAKQNEKKGEEDSSDGDEGTSQIVIGDNFWANGGETDNATANNNENDDFWTNGGSDDETNEEDSDDDFWTGGGDGSQSLNGTAAYKIVKRDGKQGVVGSNGTILIPFREWVVKLYKDGIAKVVITLDGTNYSIGSLFSPYENQRCDELFGNTNWSEVIYERKLIIGFVNLSGEWIIEPDKVLNRLIKLWYADMGGRGGSYYQRKLPFVKRCYDFLLTRAKSLPVSPGFKLVVEEGGLE
ncbi:MAG TPA: hypothetical protein VF181_10330 [Balneolaceae bacterium]